MAGFYKLKILFMAVLDIIKQKTHRTENYKCYKQNDVSCQQLYLVFLLLLVYGNPLVFEFFRDRSSSVFRRRLFFCN